MRRGKDGSKPFFDSSINFNTVQKDVWAVSHLYN